MIQHRVNCAAVGQGCTAALNWNDEWEDVDPDRMAARAWHLVDDLWTCPRHANLTSTAVFGTGEGAGSA